MARSHRSRLRFAALLATTACAAVAAAPLRAQTSDTPSPVRSQLDQNDVDLTRGTYSTYVTDVTIGAGEAGLAYARPFGQTSGGGSNWDLGVFTASSTQVSATIGFKAFLFNKSGSTFTSADGSGATLTLSGGAYTLTLADGTIVVYGNGTHDSSDIMRLSRGTSITSPSGDKATLTYATATWCTNNLDGCTNGQWLTGVRLQSVMNSLGYQLHFDYGRADNGMMTNTQGQAWRRLDAVTAINMAVDYCDPAGHRCSYSKTWPSASYSGSAVTDALGHTSYYAPVVANGNVTGYAITRAGTAAGSGPDLVVTLNSSFKVSTVSRRVSNIASENMVWSYTYPLANTIDIADPLGHHRVVTSDPAVGLPMAVKNEVNYTTQFQYYSNGTLQRAIAPEGNYVEYTYDPRGNVTQTSGVAKAGTGFAPIVSTAIYPSCTVGPACNRPTSVTDARGNTTDYTYDSTHGGVLTATAPAPTAGAVRPQTRYTYTALQAAYKNSGGAIVASGQSSYRLTAISSCQTGASCAGTADEVRSEVDYGSAVAGVPNNLLPTRVTTKAGDNSLVATVDTAYDDIGNAVSVDGPLAGDADKTVFRYDAGRQLVGTVSPDPDGTGLLKNRAVRTTYNPDGQATKMEQGYVAGQTDADWPGFTPLQTVDTAYDGGARPIVQWTSAGGTIFSVTQTAYDGEGRPVCAAVRMNPADFPTPPANVCAQTANQSADGPDRIRVTTWDDANRVTAQSSGYGTGDVSDDVVSTYTPNGMVETVTDAEGNRTTYEYDGHDRLAKTRYPLKTAHSNASASGDPNVAGNDFEQLTYETTAGGTRTSGTVGSLRNRAGETTSFGYDALGRTILRDLPGTEPDASYGYDLLGRLTGASVSGYALTFGWDALGRMKSQTGPRGSYGLEHDLAGRLTKLTWPDTFYVTYDYLNTGEVLRVREQPAGTGLILAEVGYDAASAAGQQGRRTSMAYANGDTVSYGYDALGRLANQTDDLAGTAYDLTVNYGYNHAGQISSETRSNDLYAWTGHGNGSTSYAINGLNQIASAGGTTLGYDARGNMTSDGSQTFGYDSHNRMTVPIAGVGFRFDPFDRIYELDIGSNPSRYYDKVEGNELTHVSSANAVQRRFVYLPGETGPRLWYEGSGTATRRYFHQDLRGSMINVTSQAGAPVYSTNSYEEYGRMSGAVSFFGFTGQEAFNFATSFKARFYSAPLGRFLSPDPTGYGDGMNMYGYVSGDPINATDPTGLATKRPVASRPKSEGGSGGSGGGGAIVITGHRDIFGAMADTEAMLNFIDLANQMRGTQATNTQEIVINGKKPKDEADDEDDDSDDTAPVSIPPSPGAAPPQDAGKHGGVPAERKVLTCGIQPGVCRLVPRRQYCVIARTRLAFFGIGAAAASSASGFKGAHNLSGAGRASRGIGLAQALIGAEVAADLLDQYLYCD